jgi:hypothetical protein
LEANKNDYFVDGFFIKHFGVFPQGIDKNNLFDEQKSFIIYLMGIIPDYQNWKVQIDYQTELKEIKNLKEIEISQSDIDLAKMQGRDIEQIKQERLSSEKEIRISELNKKYGIEEKKEEIKLPDNLPEDFQQSQKSIMEILQGKGFVK